MDFRCDGQRFGGDGKIDANTASIHAKILSFLGGGGVDAGRLRLQAPKVVLAATLALLREGTSLFDSGEHSQHGASSFLSFASPSMRVPPVRAYYSRIDQQ